MGSLLGATTGCQSPPQVPSCCCHLQQRRARQQKCRCSPVTGLHAFHVLLHDLREVGLCQRRLVGDLQLPKCCLVLLYLVLLLYQLDKLAAELLKLHMQHKQQQNVDSGLCSLPDAGAPCGRPSAHPHGTATAATPPAVHVRTLPSSCSSAYSWAASMMTSLHDVKFCTTEFQALLLVGCPPTQQHSMLSTAGTPLPAR